MTVTIALTIFFAIITVSCNISGNECGPFDGKFKTVGFNTDLITILIQDGSISDVQYSFLESDTIEFDRFGLSMFPVAKYYALNTVRPNSFSLMPSAFACSPPIPVSEETITDIQIFSNKNFNSEYAIGENLADLFEIIVFYGGSGYQRSTLNEFLSSEPNVPDEIFLALKSAPATTKPVQFTVNYSQNGIDMNSYEFTTQAIVITN